MQAEAEAIGALRKALAQPEQDWEDLYRKEKARADMWRDKYESMAGPDERVYPQPEQESDRWGAGYEAGYAAGMAEQPEQEPVAWMYVGLTFNNDMHGPHLVWKPEHMDAMSAEKGVVASPLYTHPPRREPEQEPEQQCSGCGKTDPGWALYCVECIEGKIRPALEQEP